LSVVLDVVFLAVVLSSWLFAARSTLGRRLETADISLATSSSILASSSQYLGKVPLYIF
jgi:hypothetical protein